MSGPNSILKYLPMPEVEALIKCAHISANQIVNYLLAFYSDVFFGWVFIIIDWIVMIDTSVSFFRTDMRV